MAEPVEITANYFRKSIPKGFEGNSDFFRYVEGLEIKIHRDLIPLLRRLVVDAYGLGERTSDGEGFVTSANYFKKFIGEELRVGFDNLLLLASELGSSSFYNGNFDRKEDLKNHFER